MSQIRVKAVIANGFTPDDRIEVEVAIVDPRSDLLTMPRSMIQRLGSMLPRRVRLHTQDGDCETTAFDYVHLTVQGHDCQCEVIEVPDGSPVTIGKIVLHMLDLVIDPEGRQLIGNPAHGGEQMIELY